MPELSLHADLILLADIEPNLHKHTEHLRHCFVKSRTPNEFIYNYSIKNPIANPLLDKSEILIQDFLEELKSRKSSLHGYHFISSQQRFDECKNAENKLAFAHINFNLLGTDDCPNPCRILSDLLKKHNAILTFSNLTNIHQYCSDRRDQLERNVNSLFQDAKDYFVMYSIYGEKYIEAQISDSLTEYFNKTATARLSNFSLFSNQDNNARPDVSNNNANKYFKAGL